MRDRIWVNAKILTMDPLRPHVDAVLTSGERIVFTGSIEEVRSLARPGAQEIDLGGAFMIPA
ncbi:MAG: hypothetical protein R2845_14000 [Thermomicrobiales bacterium]